MTKTLLYGGTFDPPHFAHVTLPDVAMQHLKFDRVLYVPSYQTPLKNFPCTSIVHRLAMLTLALHDCPWAEITTIELDRGGTSYTIDTVQALQQEGQELRLLIGADQWAQFKKWKDWEDLIKIANPAIMPRKGFDVSDSRLLPINPLPAVSSNIRELLHDGKNIDEFVPSTVVSYITEHQLYQ